jgi:hypothetical protein
MNYHKGSATSPHGPIRTGTSLQLSGAPRYFQAGERTTKQRSTEQALVEIAARYWSPSVE